jgi:hypothetical protein
MELLQFSSYRAKFSIFFSAFIGLSIAKSNLYANDFIMAINKQNSGTCTLNYKHKVTDKSGCYNQEPRDVRVDRD